MNRAATLVIAAFVLLSVVGCQRDRPPSQAEPILMGVHSLRKMVSMADTKSQVSAGFFLIVGDVHATTSTSVSLKFAWRMRDGMYAISSLPIEKIRVQIDETSETPTIKFRWLRCHSREIQILMDRCVIYAVVTAREKDWPVQINLPLNQ